MQAIATLSLTTGERTRDAAWRGVAVEGPRRVKIVTTPCRLLYYYLPAAHNFLATIWPLIEILRSLVLHFMVWETVWRWLLDDQFSYRFVFVNTVIVLTQHQHVTDVRKDRRTELLYQYRAVRTGSCAQCAELSRCAMNPCTHSYVLSILIRSYCSLRSYTPYLLVN